LSKIADNIASPIFPPPIKAIFTLALLFYPASFY